MPDGTPTAPSDGFAAFADEMDEWLQRAEEPAVPDETSAGFQRAGLSAKVAAFYAAVGASGVNGAPYAGMPVREWRNQVNGELPTHEPEIEDAEMMAFADDNLGGLGVDARRCLVPMMAPEDAWKVVVDRRKAVTAAAAPEAPVVSDAAILTPEPELTPLPEPPSEEAPEADAEQPQDPGEVATWHVEFRITGQYQDAVSLGKRLGDQADMVPYITRSRGGRPVKPGIETVLERLATPEGISSGEIKTLLGWQKSAPALSHVKQQARRIGREHDVEDMVLDTGKVGIGEAKRFRFKPSVIG